jgi:HlyD family secretion protein
MRNETQPGMPASKKKRAWKWAAVFVLVAVGGLVLYRGWASNQKRTVGSRAARGEIPVEISAAQRGDITYVFNATGDISALMQVDLFPKVSGYLEKISVNLGDSVRQGQGIAQIDRSDFLQKVREVEARVGQAKAALSELDAGTRSEDIRQAEEAVKQAQSRYDNAKAQRERMEALFKKQIISKKDFDNADTECSVCDAQLASSQERLKQLKEGTRQEVKDAGRARLKEMEAILAQEQTRLENATITAPFSGEITRRYVDAGALVSASTPLVTLAHTETVKVTANLLEKDVSLVKPGMKAKIRAEAFPEKIFEGTIVRINSALDLATRTLQTEIHIPNPGRMLKPGMFAKIEIALSTKAGAVTVPKVAVIEEGKERAVFVIDNNQALRKTVVIGIEQGDRVEVVEGIREGEQIVIKGQGSLKDRSPVRVIEGG